MLIAAIFMPMVVFAAPTATPQQQVLRVSCPLQEGFFEVDANGNYSGYSYEYLMKVAQHTGWKYDFKVYMPTSENLATALEQVKSGEIDLMTGMVYSDELAEKHEFTLVPYGQSNYVLMADVNNDWLNQRTYADRRGLRVALNKTAEASNSMFEAFCKKEGLNYEMIYTTSAEREQMVQSGKADLLICKDIVKTEGFKIITKFASEPFYFATTKGNTALATRLSRVVSEIQDVDPYYSSKLHDKYFSFESDFKLALTSEEQEFLKSSPTIRMVVLTGRSPIQDYDPVTGEYSGIVIDVIRKISEESGLQVEFIPARNLAHAKQMLDSHEVDAFAGFPYNYASAEEYNLLLTSPIFTMPVVRLSNISGKANNIETLVSTSIKLFDNQKNIIYVEDLKEIFDKINRGEYKEAYVNGYMAQQCIKQGDYSNTALMPTPYSNYEICIGVNRLSDVRMMCILEQMISKLRLINVEDIVYQNTTVDYEISLLDMVRRNPIEVLGPTLLIFVLLTSALCVMVVKTWRLNKIISKERNKYQEISAKDALSQAYNNDTFKRLCKEYLSSGSHMPGTLLMCDIDNFKLINDTYGHIVGDEVIQRLGEILQELFPNDFVGRLGGDEFAILVKGTSDVDSVKRHCKALLACSVGISAQCKLTLSIGAAAFDTQVAFEELYENADKALYIVKNRGKNGYEIVPASSDHTNLIDD